MVSQNAVSINELVAGIIETLSAPVFIVDEAGMFIAAFTNERTTELLSAEPAEFVGNDLYDLFPDEEAGEFHAVIERALETESVQNYEYQLQTKAGVRCFSSHVAPMPGESETQVICLAEDVTKQVELQKDYQRQYHHLARTENLANMGGWEYIPAEETVIWTEGVSTIFEVADDYTPSLDNVFEFFVPRDRDRLEQAFEQCLQSGLIYEFDAQIITAKGRHRWVSVRGERVNEQDVTKIVGVVQDITEQKLDEQRLMVLNRVLRHNLRNQLNTIMGYAELIEDELPGEMQELFANIDTSARSLLSLANKSRRFNHVIEYDFTAEEVDLQSVITETCASFRESYPAATITANCSELTVATNEVAIRLIVEELVSNALRHAKTASPHVSISTNPQGANQVSITVADDGPGLPDQEKAVLQHGEETQLLHSDGMGLWTVNWIVTKLSGGTSVAENSPSGTIITVTLPTSTV